MENLLDLTDPVEEAETESTTQPLTEVESQTPAVPNDIEEIDTAPGDEVTKAHPGSSVTKPAPYKREELPPSPLLLDPYEWDRCTITVGYSLLPDKKVSVSVHNHKDEPIVKDFAAEAVPLPEKISGVIAALQAMWPMCPVNVTVALLPKPNDASERPIIAAVRVSTDTPIMQEGFESNLPFPTPIVAMLDELKALLPERALKSIERNAKAKTDPTVKPTSRSATSKPAAVASAPSASKNERKNQMTLF
jgi:hypothetical protein